VLLQPIKTVVIEPNRPCTSVSLPSQDFKISAMECNGTRVNNRCWHHNDEFLGRQVHGAAKSLTGGRHDPGKPRTTCGPPGNETLVIRAYQNPRDYREMQTSTGPTGSLLENCVRRLKYGPRTLSDPEYFAFRDHAWGRFKWAVTVPRESAPY